MMIQSLRLKVYFEKAVVAKRTTNKTKLNLTESNSFQLNVTQLNEMLNASSKNITSHAQSMPFGITKKYIRSQLTAELNAIFMLIKD